MGWNYDCYICGEKIIGSGMVLSDTNFSDDIEGGYESANGDDLYVCNNCLEEKTKKEEKIVIATGLDDLEVQQYIDSLEKVTFSGYPFSTRSMKVKKFILDLMKKYLIESSNKEGD